MDDRHVPTILLDEAGGLDLDAPRAPGRAIAMFGERPSSPTVAG